MNEIERDIALKRIATDLVIAAMTSGKSAIAWELLDNHDGQKREVAAQRIAETVLKIQAALLAGSPD